MKEQEPTGTKDSLRLNNRLAIVTGAASGIGRAISLLFAEHGARVTVADINDIGGQETVDLIRDSGGEAIFQHTDVTKPDDVMRMITRAIETFGRVNILVNNAAAFVFGKIEDITPEDWQKVLGVNVIGYANCVQAALPSMKEAGGGTIVNIASVSSFIAGPEMVPYNTSKAAILGLTRSLARDLATYNIRVNAVCPGSILTPAADYDIRRLGLDLEEGYRQFGDEAFLKRMGTPREVAYGALFLASDESSFVTGTHLVMDGGATID